jgi:hypothetical protein
MTVVTFARQCAATAGVLVTVALPAAAQPRVAAINPGQFGLIVASDRVVKDAPYSADAVTTVTQILGDGTKIERSVTAKVYRDGAGRIRREQTVLGLASLAPARDGQRTITISDPVEGMAITLDEQARTARRTRIRSILFLNNGALFMPANPANTQLFTLTRDGGSLTLLDPSAPRQRSDDFYIRRAPSAGYRLGSDQSLSDLLSLLQLQSGRGAGAGSRTLAAAGAPPVTTALGNRTIEGLSTRGTRTTQTIPAGAIGNDRPIVISDEIWESDALQEVVASKHVDPRTGTVDYKLTNVRLGEPPAELFTIPQGYTIIGPAAAPLPQPAPASPAPGSRSGGRAQ